MPDPNAAGGMIFYVFLVIVFSNFVLLQGSKNGSLDKSGLSITATAAKLRNLSRLKDFGKAKTKEKIKNKEPRYTEDDHNLHKKNKASFGKTRKGSRGYRRAKRKGRSIMLTNRD